MKLTGLDVDVLESMAQQDAAWPMMKRVNDARRTLIMPERECVLRRFESEKDAMSYAIHGFHLAQTGWSQPCHYVGGQWTAQKLVHASDDKKPTVSGIVRIISMIHGASGMNGCPRDFASEELMRVCDRETRNHKAELVDEFASKWPDTLQSLRGPWHGDPTLTNCIVDANGRLWLIDHSPRIYGPQEYDYAKLRRCLLISDEGVINQDEITKARGDKWLRVVIAGMLGSHCGEMREKLREVWRCITM